MAYVSETLQSKAQVKNEDSEQLLRFKEEEETGAFPQIHLVYLYKSE
jgi:hypothetical protein